ncbi:transporter suffix domain-containing protein [Maribellus sediminis]|uniref:transporter suffix domain-containing protein n=1 Tax=Maribellus sediminis TaxID=2696285 RepID=UPI0014307B0D|nr:transporter suffix domain-containing protein [Maribellus sediminis]
MKNRDNKQIKLGIFLMVFSGVFFAATIIIPFFDLPAKTKVVASTTSFILMEVVFWLGGLLVGKELFTRYKQKLDPRNWFKKKNDTESTSD